MKAFLCVRSQGGGLHTVLVLAEFEALDLKVNGDLVTVSKNMGAGTYQTVAAVKASENYFVTVGDEPPTMTRHQAG